MSKTVTASARKSLGEFKPLLVFPSGKTTVCHQALAKYERGYTFKTRADAVACAQKVINKNLLAIVERATKQASHPARVARFQADFSMWGGAGAIEDAVSALSALSAQR